MEVVCVVCSKRIKGPSWTVGGNPICADHLHLPRCRYCGLPTQDTFGGVPRCTRCAVTGVDEIDTAEVHFTTVRRTLESIGLSVEAPVRVFLRDNRTWLRTGHFATSRCQGITTWRRRSGSLRVSIGLEAGAPALQFQGIVAHEWGHAFVADHRPVRADPLPRIVSEGFAEYVEYIFMLKHCPLSGARERAGVLLANPDPIYGDGLRLVKRAVANHGSRAVALAVTTGQLPDVGL